MSGARVRLVSEADGYGVEVAGERVGSVRLARVSQPRWEALDAAGGVVGRSREGRYGAVALLVGRDFQHAD